MRTIEELRTIANKMGKSLETLLYEMLSDAMEENEKYKSRNEKAIEWCKCVINSKTTVGELPNGKRTDMGYCLDLAEPLLNILKGENDERRDMEYNSYSQ